MKIFKAMVLGEAVGQKEQNSFQETDNDLTKRTKIKRPRRKQSTQPPNETNGVIYLADVSGMSRTNLTINDGLTTNQNFWPNINALQTECQEIISNPQITQSFDQLGVTEDRISSDKSIEIMDSHLDLGSIRNRKLRGRMGSKRPTNASRHQESFEKGEIVEGAIETQIFDVQIRENLNNKRLGFIQSWGKLKDRMNRRGNVKYEADSSSWLKNIKKLKTRLRNNSTAIINLGSENHNN